MWKKVENNSPIAESSTATANNQINQAEPYET